MVIPGLPSGIFDPYQEMTILLLHDFMWDLFVPFGVVCGLLAIWFSQYRFLATATGGPMVTTLRFAVAAAFIASYKLLFIVILGIGTFIAYSIASGVKSKTPWLPSTVLLSNPSVFLGKESRNKNQTNTNTGNTNNGNSNSGNNGNNGSVNANTVNSNSVNDDTTDNSSNGLTLTGIINVIFMLILWFAVTVISILWMVNVSVLYISAPLVTTLFLVPNLGERILGYWFSSLVRCAVWQVMLSLFSTLALAFTLENFSSFPGVSEGLYNIAFAGLFSVLFISTPKLSGMIVPDELFGSLVSTAMSSMHATVADITALSGSGLHELAAKAESLNSPRTAAVIAMTGDFFKLGAATLDALGSNFYNFYRPFLYGPFSRQTYHSFKQLANSLNPFKPKQQKQQSNNDSRSQQEYKQSSQQSSRTKAQTDSSFSSKKESSAGSTGSSSSDSYASGSHAFAGTSSSADSSAGEANSSDASSSTNNNTDPFSSTKSDETSSNDESSSTSTKFSPAFTTDTSFQSDTAQQIHKDEFENLINDFLNGKETEPSFIKPSQAKLLRSKIKKLKKWAETTENITVNITNKGITFVSKSKNKEYQFWEFKSDSASEVLTYLYIATKVVPVSDIVAKTQSSSLVNASIEALKTINSSLGNATETKSIGDLMFKVNMLDALETSCMRETEFAQEINNATFSEVESLLNIPLTERIESDEMIQFATVSAMLSELESLNNTEIVEQITKWLSGENSELIDQYSERLRKVSKNMQAYSFDPFHKVELKSNVTDNVTLKALGMILHDKTAIVSSPDAVYYVTNANKDPVCPDMVDREIFLKNRKVFVYSKKKKDIF